MPVYLEHLFKFRRNWADDQNTYGRISNQSQEPEKG